MKIQRFLVAAGLILMSLSAIHAERIYVKDLQAGDHIILHVKGDTQAQGGGHFNPILKKGYYLAKLYKAAEVIEGSVTLYLKRPSMGKPTKGLPMVDIKLYTHPSDAYWFKESDGREYTYRNMEGHQRGWYPPLRERMAACNEEESTLMGNGETGTVSHDAALSPGDDEIKQSNLMAGENLTPFTVYRVYWPVPNVTKLSLGAQHKSWWRLCG